MQAGFKLGMGGRLDVLSERAARRVVVEFMSAPDAATPSVVFMLTPSEARAIAYALTGASNEL